MGELLKVLRTLVKNLIAADSRTRSWLVSHLFVPGAVIAVAASGLVGTGRLWQETEVIAAVPLRSVVRSTGEIKGMSGMMMAVEPSPLEFGLRWTSPGATSILTSLDAPTLRLNQKAGRIAVDEEHVTAKLPLLGTREAVYLVADRSSEEILTGGKRLSIDRLGKASGSSAALATWAVLAAVFGLGLGLSRPEIIGAALGDE